MKTRYLVTWLMIFATMGAHADEVCNSWRKCMNLKTQLDQKIRTLPRFSDFARTKTGEVDLMVQSSELMKKNGFPIRDGKVGALEYCAQKGMRLPNAKELAQLYAYEVSDKRTDDYYVNVENSDGRREGFSVSGWTNSGPEGELKNWVWTSSKLPHTDKFYIFNGEGNVNDESVEAPIAVRCVLQN